MASSLTPGSGVGIGSSGGGGGISSTATRQHLFRTEFAGFAVSTAVA